MSAITQKQTLRVKGKQKRGAFDHAAADRAILKTILKTPAFRGCDLLLCYVSVATEADTHALLAHCFAVGKRVAVPRCESGGVMQFHEVRSFAQLDVSPFGIPEPAADAPTPVCTAKTLCVVPGLLFDKAGYRIGYGGGYYDRFLARFPGKTIGLCYEALLAERLPREPFDQQVMQIITEQHILTV